MRKIEITNLNGKWLINGKPYAELTYQERSFFDEFLIEMRIKFETQKAV